MMKHYSRALSKPGRAMPCRVAVLGALLLVALGSVCFAGVIPAEGIREPAISNSPSALRLLVTGYNGWGQLGFGDTTNRKAFTQVPGLTSVIVIAAGLLVFVGAFNNAGEINHTVTTTITWTGNLVTAISRAIT